MPRKILTSIALLFLTLAAVFFGRNLATGLQVSEKLYPVETTQKISRPVGEIYKNSLGANPFIPILPKKERPATSTSLLASDLIAAQKLEARKINLIVSPSGKEIDTKVLNHCKALVSKTLDTLPSNLTASLKNLTLYLTADKSRGLGNSHLVELRCTNLGDEELVSVFTHELGHVVDLGYLRGSGNLPSKFKDGSLIITKDDLSVIFYELSWKTSTKQHFTAKRDDFVSGYAMTDAFEDFAESFNFYTLHGSDFRKLAQESKILQAKYDFLKEYIFQNKEFDSAVIAESGKRVWDTTLMPIALEEFFARG
jgi:hypothetical protein